MPFGRVVVGGHSMEPALRHGDRLVYAPLRPRRGDVVIARDRRDIAERWIVKRVAALTERGVSLASDLAGHERLDVARGDVIGRAVLRYRPLRRFAFL